MRVFHLICVSTFVTLHAIAEEDISCWVGDVNAQFCCYPIEAGGNADCWAGKYIFENCCAMEILQWGVEWESTSTTTSSTSAPSAVEENAFVETQSLVESAQNSEIIVVDGVVGGILHDNDDGVGKDSALFDDADCWSDAHGEANCCYPLADGGNPSCFFEEWNMTFKRCCSRAYHREAAQFFGLSFKEDGRVNCWSPGFGPASCCWPFDGKGNARACFIPPLSYDLCGCNEIPLEEKEEIRWSQCFGPRAWNAQKVFRFNPWEDYSLDVLRTFGQDLKIFSPLIYTGIGRMFQIGYASPEFCCLPIETQGHPRCWTGPLKERRASWDICCAELPIVQDELRRRNDFFALGDSSISTQYDASKAECEAKLWDAQLMSASGKLTNTSKALRWDLGSPDYCMDNEAKGTFWWVSVTAPSTAKSDETSNENLHYGLKYIAGHCLPKMCPRSLVPELVRQRVSAELASLEQNTNSASILSDFQTTIDEFVPLSAGFYHAIFGNGALVFYVLVLAMLPCVLASVLEFLQGHKNSMSIQTQLALLVAASQTSTTMAKTSASVSSTPRLLVPDVIRSIGLFGVLWSHSYGHYHTNWITTSNMNHCLFFLSRLGAGIGNSSLLYLSPYFLGKRFGFIVGDRSKSRDGQANEQSPIVDVGIVVRKLCRQTPVIALHAIILEFGYKGFTNLTHPLLGYYVYNDPIPLTDQCSRKGWWGFPFSAFPVLPHLNYCHKSWVWSFELQAFLALFTLISFCRFASALQKSSFIGSKSSSLSRFVRSLPDFGAVVMIASIVLAMLWPMWRWYQLPAIHSETLLDTFDIEWNTFIGYMVGAVFAQYPFSFSKTLTWAFVAVWAARSCWPNIQEYLGFTNQEDVMAHVFVWCRSRFRKMFDSSYQESCFDSSVGAGEGYSVGCCFPLAHGGNPQCFDSNYTFERCCDDELVYHELSKGTPRQIFNYFASICVGMLIQIALTSFLAREEKDIKTDRDSSSRNGNGSANRNSSASRSSSGWQQTMCRKLSMLSFSILVTHIFAFDVIMIAFGHLERRTSGNLV